MTTTRIEDLDWPAITGHLDLQGWAVLPRLLTANQSDSIAGMYGDTPAFRSHVVMARHGFEKGALPHVDCYRRSSLPQVVCYRAVAGREAPKWQGGSA